MRRKKACIVTVFLLFGLLLNSNMTEPSLKLSAENIFTTENMRSSGVSENIASETDAEEAIDFGDGNTENNLSDEDTGEQADSIIEEASTESQAETSTTTTQNLEDLVSDIIVVFDSEAPQYTLPSTVDEYINARDVNGITEFCISSAQDFIDAQTLCADSSVNGFEGITLTITSPASSGKWDITGIEGFTGIGTEENPFKGTLACYYPNGEGGVRFYTNKPIIAYMGDGAKITQMDIACEVDGDNNASVAAIAGNISGNVTIHDVWIRGTIGSGTGTVGIIAGNIDADSVVDVSAVKVPTKQVKQKDANDNEVEITVSDLTVSGAVAGGIAGTAGSNVVIKMDDDVAIGTSGYEITLTGTEAVGGFFGIATGNQSWDLMNSYIYDKDDDGNTTSVAQNKLCVTVIGSSSSCYMGQFAGKLQSDGTEGTLEITGGDMIAVNMNSTDTSSNLGSAGGIVGICGEGTKIVKPEGEFTISGNIVAINGHSGGIAAVMVNPCMELNDYTIDATIQNYYTAGGLIGEMQGGKCIIKNMTLSSNSKVTDNHSYGGSYCGGGVIGKVSNAGAVELQGTISILVNPSHGLVVGTIDRALIYYSEPEGMIAGEVDENGDIQETSQLIKPANSTLNEIHTYGGVYRNQDMGSGKLLIGDRTLDNVGVINNAIAEVGITNDDVTENWYQLTSAADFECLAIVLGSEGKHGKSVFGLSDDADYAVLLNSNYEVTKSVDISYDKTGIVTLNRNDKYNNVAYAFSGKMKGKDDSITIKQSMNIRQMYVGLFCAITGTPEFANLTLDGTITNAFGVGGIAYQFIDARDTVSSLTLSNITTRKVISDCLNGYNLGGIIASESCSYGEITIIADNITLKADINAGSYARYSSFITDISNANISISNVTLGGKLQSTNTGSVGGFLGYAWSNIRGSIKNLYVEDKAEYVVSGYFGVLLKSVSTQNVNGARLTLDNIKLNGLTVDIKSQRPNCGLLFQEITSAVVEIIDYDCSGCVVKNPGTTISSYFDEVAGQTKINSVNNVGSFVYNTGIVSLHNSDKNFPDYHYENAATYCDKDGNTITGPTDNQYTMYFYDVFQYFEDDDGNVIDSRKIASNDEGYYVLDAPEKMLLWDALQLANSSLRSSFSAYYAYEGTFNITSLVYNNQYVFKGKLDLSDISFYPVANILTSGSFIGEDNATIIFAADKLGVENEKVGNRHYGMHAGLFYNTCQQNLKLSVSDITLSGTIANMGADSGALIVGGNIITGGYGSKGLSNGGTFKNIILDELWVANYDGTVGTKGATALLISKISQSTATFNNITMVNYPKNSDTKAAAALISVAGNSDVTNLTLLFENMIVADDVDGGTEHNGDVLSHASFIYHYDYTDDATINTGSGIYFFSTEDCDNNNVTFGNELDAYTEFSDTADLVLDTLSISAADYKPYVYELSDKDIAINPKTGDILKGCGTYEDPYIIENERQFLTLYRYINEIGTSGSYQYQNFYESGDGWKIVIPGDDSSFCSEKHEVTWDSATQSFVSVNNSDTADGSEGDSDSTEDGTDTDESDSDSTEDGSDTDESDDTDAEEKPVAVSIKYNPDDFPTPDELSRAYYRLEEDIDLTSLKDATYKTIADEFAGFGTEDRPFVGVWLGKGSDDEIHTITLPDYAVNYETFGFIRYAKGVVVKDLNIKTAHKDLNAVDSSVTTGISEAGGGVIGIILGGDNIIDNVTVEVDYVVASTNAAVGGYVGIIRKGGMILRNINDSALTGYRLGTSQNATYPSLGAIAGKVEDGYAVYEGTDSNDSDGDSSSYLWSGNGGNTEYAAIPDYTILDGRVLKEESDDISITLSEDAQSTNIIDINITIPNDAALQVMSMALNADALNIYYDADTYYVQNGYRNTSRCRKADYSDIGCAASTADYIAAAKYDNLMGYSYVDASGNSMDANNAYLYPYLYDYMGITGDEYISYSAKYSGQEYYYSILNPSTFWYTYVKDGNEVRVNYRANWALVEGLTYDMAQFGNSFRGIGAIYQLGDIYGGSFRGNFDGNNSTIVLDMNRNAYSNYNVSYTYCKAGLFNTIYGSSSLPYNHTADFVDTVSASSSSTEIKCFTIKNIKLAGQINVTGISANTTVDVGGIVGGIQNANYIFDNITSDDTNPLTIGNIGNDTTNYIRSAGGIIGNVFSGGNILIQNCVISGTESKNVSIKGTAGSCGGLVGMFYYGRVKIAASKINYLTIESTASCAGGMIGNNMSTVIFAGTEDDPIFVGNSTIKGTQTGGYIGASGSNVFMAGVNCEDCSIGYNNNSIYAGGLIGNATGRFVISDALCDRLRIGAYGCMGGVVAYTYRTSTSTITDVVVSDLIIEENASAISACYMGGVIGYGYVSLTLENVDVIGTKTDDAYNFQIITQDKKRGAYVGGLIAYNYSTVTLNGCTVDTVMMTGDATNNSVCAGGAVGYTQSNIYVPGKLTTKNLYIDVNPQNKAYSTSTDNSMRIAGGCFGYIWNSNYSQICSGNSADQFCYGITATGNAISGRQVGGIIGVTLNNNIKLCGIEVSGSILTADDCAGGVIGKIEAKNNTTYNQFVIKAAAVKGSENDSDTQYIVNSVSNVDVTAPSAGGFIGYYYGQYGIVTTEGIVIEDCSVVSKMCERSYWNSGGVIGTLEGGGDHTLRCNDVSLDNNLIVCEVEDDTLTDTECNCIASGGVIGKLENKASKELGQCLMDNIFVKDSNVIGVRKAGTTDVKLVQHVAADDTNSLILSEATLPLAGDGIAYDYEAIDSLEQDYGYFVGNYVGTYTSHADGSESNIDIYILASDDTENAFVIPVMKSNPPVVDVGRNYKDYDTVNEDTYREFCHIIYGASNDLAKDASADLTDMKAKVENIESAYSENETLNALLKEIRISEDAIKTFNTAYAEKYTVINVTEDAETGEEVENSEVIDFPVLVYRVQDGTLQNTMEDITDVMTSVSGIPSTNMGVISVTSTPMLSVTCEPMVYDSSTKASTAGEEGTASVSASVSDDGIVTFTSEGYDSVVDGKMSYTLVTYTYSWYDTDDSEYHQKVFELPIFIEEPILYSVHTMLMEGKVTSVDTIREKGVIENGGNNNIIMANDSDYTMLIEYTYGQARGWMQEDVVMDKEFYLEGSDGEDKSYAVGTRLVLIDVTDGNKAYYYTVESEVDKIYFSYFKDSQGNSYVNQPINNLPDETDDGEDYYTDLMGHKLTNVGIQRYLLTVLKDDSDKAFQVFTMHCGIHTEYEDLAARFQAEAEHNEESVWSVRAIPGLSISLIGKESDETDTDISGKLDKEDGLNVKATFALRADSAYWTERASAGGIIDSSNNGKYLEIAFYIRDESNNLVNLPVGTNFTYKLGDGSYSNNKALTDSSMIYYYKDIRNIFEIDDFEYLIDNIDQNVSVPVEFNLDFSGADMSEITDDAYIAKIELLKTSNKNYPMGSNNEVDEYSEIVYAEPAEQFGFVLRADDLTDLAINTYPEANTQDTIPCHVMFDFSGLLKAAGNENEQAQVINTWANYDYEVTYQLYKKTLNGDTITYEPYTGTDIAISAADGSTSSEDGTLSEVVMSSETGNGSLKVTYNFSADAIKDGYGSDSREGLLSLPVIITQSTKSLTDDEDNLTNYKLEATLVIREKGTSGEVSDKTIDFLIYTVTKLKIDM